MNNITDDFQNIKMPENIDLRIRESLIKADKEKKRKKSIIKSLKYSAAAAGLVLIYGIGVNASPVFASATKGMPLFKELTRVLQIYPDKNIQNAVNNGFVQEINQTKVSNGVELTLDSVISDERKAIITYTLKTEDKSLTNLLIKDLKVFDKENKLITSSQENFGRNEENNVYNIELFNHKGNSPYTGRIMTNYELSKDFPKTGETKGLIEITSYDQSKPITDILYLDFSKILEAYPEPGNDLNEHPDDYNYNSFKVKYKREPKIFDGDWKFNVKLDNNLKSKISTDYNNIKFTALNINFNVEYLKIYPTTIDVKITNDYKEKIPVVIMDSYLEDEKGNKYKQISIGGSATNQNDPALYGAFESPYFNNPKHLYYVIDEIWIGDPDSHPDFRHKIEPIRIQLK